MLFTLLYYLYFIVVTPVFFVLACVVTLVTCPFDRNRRILHYYSRFWGLQYYWVSPGWHIHVEGLENITPGKHYVIMSNHQSMLDICLLYKLPQVFKWVSKKEAQRIPLVGWALWLHRDIIISRGDRAGLKKLLHASQKYLHRGVSVILFPEGTRSKDGQIHDFKEGGFLMARMSGVAILPVVIDGNFDVFSGWKLRRKQHFHLKVLPEVPESEVAAHSPKETMAKVFRAFQDVRNTDKRH